jgi:hypothetical protein
MLYHRCQYAVSSLPICCIIVVSLAASRPVRARVRRPPAGTSAEERLPLAEERRGRLPLHLLYSAHRVLHSAARAVLLPAARRMDMVRMRGRRSGRAACAHGATNILCICIYIYIYYYIYTIYTVHTIYTVFIYRRRSGRAACAHGGGERAADKGRETPQSQHDTDYSMLSSSRPLSTPVTACSRPLVLYQHRLQHALVLSSFINTCYSMLSSSRPLSTPLTACSASRSPSAACAHGACEQGVHSLMHQTHTHVGCADGCACARPRHAGVPCRPVSASPCPSRHASMYAGV